MTARLSITVYDTDAAVVVPVTAVRRDDAGAWVFKRGSGDKAEPVKITLGATAAQVVEVVSGLAAGEIVVVNARNVEP